MKLLIDVEVLFDKVNVDGDETEDTVSASNTLGISTKDENDVQIQHNMRSRRYNILNVGDLTNALENMPKDIELQIEHSPLKHSGLKINKINKITIHYDKYNPNRAGKCMELPEWISKKKACINIQNDDELCFKYCVLCKFYEVFKKDHPQHMRHCKKLITTESLINGMV